jgi:ATP-dependent Lon protease
LKSIQIATFDLADDREARGQFTADEWIDLLLRTIGMEPSNFGRRVKCTRPAKHVVAGSG